MVEVPEQDNQAGAAPLVSISDVLGGGGAVKSIVTALSNAVGAIYRPIGMRREGSVLIDLEGKRILNTAKAMAQARDILADDGSQDMVRLNALSAMDRIGKIDNAAQAIGSAVEKLKAIGDAPARDISPDWMDRYMSFVERVDEDSVRDIWASVLAREAQQDLRPVSLFTLDSMRFLERRHAQLFDLFARTYLSFGRCWRQGFDVAGHREGRSLIGRSDSHNDFRALAEMGFVEFPKGDAPPLGGSYVANFHRFALRMSPTHQTETLQEVRPTMRGEELMRVILEFDLALEDVSLGFFAKRHDLRYRFLPSDRQASILANWFAWLHTKAFRLEIGVFPEGSNYLKSSFAYRWSDGYLERQPEVAVPAMAVLPDELALLVR